MTKLRAIAVIVLLGLVASSSIVAVDSGDVAVVTRFGAIDRAMGPGLNLRAPWPVEAHEVVAVSEVRRAEPGKTRMLTGDTNLVDVDLVLQYTIADPVAYLLVLESPEQTLSSIVLAATADAVSTVGVDALLTTGRTQLENTVGQATQTALDQWGAGIRIAAIEVRELSPPEVVVDAFNDVSSARGDRETLALAAEAYASERLPAVRGQAGALKEVAKAAAATRGARASGEVARFVALSEQSRSAPQATRQHLWAKTAAKVGQTVQMHVIKGDTEVRIGGAP